MSQTGVQATGRAVWCVVKAVDLGTQQPGFLFCSGHCLSFLCLAFPICKMA